APRITGPSAARFTGAAGVRGGTAKLPSNSHFTGSPHKFANTGAISHTPHLTAHTGPGNHKVITNTAFRSAFVRPRTFSGRFHGFYRPWWTGGIVIGWIGPIFWPYAYYDFFDYVFWPYV